MSPFFALFCTLLLGSSAYAAGRLHGQLTYRLGYRFGYRQGYLDGDRGAWNRRRREHQAAKHNDMPSRMGTTARGSVRVPAAMVANPQESPTHRA